MSDQEVSYGNAGLHIRGLCRSRTGYGRVGISEDPVVVQQGLLYIFLKVAFRPEGERVFATGHGVDIAQAVDVCAGNGTADLVAKGKETAHGDLRKLRRTLHVQFQNHSQPATLQADWSGLHSCVYS